MTFFSQLPALFPGPLAAPWPFRTAHQGAWVSPCSPWCVQMVPAVQAMVRAAELEGAPTDATQSVVFSDAPSGGNSSGGGGGG